MNVSIDFDAATGRVLAWYPEGANPPPAPGFSRALAARELIVEDEDGVPHVDVAALTPPLEVAKAAARRRVIVAADAITERITGRYPAAEVASWPVQEREARAVTGGAPAAEVPLLSALAATGDETVADLAAVVLAKAAAYRAVVAAVQAMHRQTMAMIDAAPDVATLDAGMAAAAQQAEAQAAAMGLAA